MKNLKSLLLTMKKPRKNLPAKKKHGSKSKPKREPYEGKPHESSRNVPSSKLNAQGS